MRGLCRIAALACLATLFAGCQWLPQPKEVDTGKADRAMDQVEKGDGS